MRVLYLGVIVPASIIIPLAAGIFRYRHLSPELRIFFYYLVIAGLVNVAAAVLAEKRINNMPLLHILTVVEFLLIAAFYRNMLGEQLQKWILWTSILFVAACVINAIFFQSIYSYNTITRSLESLLITCMAIIFFFRQLSTDPSQKQPEPVQWINAGVLLYFAGGFFLFLFSELLRKNKQADNIAWTIHATFVLIMYLLAAVGFLRAKK